VGHRAQLRGGKTAAPSRRAASLCAAASLVRPTLSKAMARLRLVRIQPQRLLELSDPLLHASRHEQDHAQIVVSLGHGGIEVQSLFELGNGLR
jgi:hypothetical protein